MLAVVLSALLAATPALVDAVKNGDKATALRLIEQRADVNAPEPDGTTALHWAVQRADVDLVDRLLKAGARAKVKNDYGATPLAEAALLGNRVLIEKLLKAGADPDSTNGDGQTALMLIARTSDVEAARLLLKAGAHVNAKEEWREQTALMWAAAQRQPEMVKALIAAGADVNAVSELNNWNRQVSGEPRALHRPVGGLSPLLFAAREGCLGCAQALAEGGANLNFMDPENISPLIMALINGRFDVANYLIDKGANVTRWDIFGRTPLYVAVDWNTVPHGGRPDQPSLDQTTALQIIQKLLGKGVNTNTQLKLLPPLRNILDDRGNDGQLSIGATPLLRAAKAFDTPAVELLLKHGANINLANTRGQTPIMVAAGMGSTDADSRGVFTSEDVQQRSIATLKVLLAAGADINQKDGTRGITALHEAARWGWNDVIKFLVANGADVRATERGGLTAVDSSLGRVGGNSRFGARTDVFPETAALLRSLGAVEGTPTAAPGGGRGAAPGGAGGGRGGGAGGAGGGAGGGRGRGANPGAGAGAAGAPPVVAAPPAGAAPAGSGAPAR